MSARPLVLAGAGGHARSCIDVIEAHGGFAILCLTGLAHERDTACLGYPVAATDDDLPTLRATAGHALVTIGQIKTAAPRVRAFAALIAAGFELPVIVSPRAHLSRHASIGRGTIVMHGAIVNAGAVVGENCIINSNALIEHDAVVGDHCHVSTAAVVNGGVRVGSGTLVGSRSVIMESLTIGAGCLVGIGAVVRHSHADHARIWGPDA